MPLFIGLFYKVRKVREKNLSKLNHKYKRLLLDGEEIETAYKKCKKSCRQHLYAFTKKRLLLIDNKGIFFGNTECTSIPYMGIAKFSFGNEKHHFGAELAIWIRGDRDPIHMNFYKQNDAYKLHEFLTRHVLR
ncbi:MAG: PH domain-containing protein [Candidatus Electrothrix sp. GW3-4]|uniref:PH domain-containing protein n=1 Tax=Candidatus Electrothrix sp. GW3-4 TaxID=3126740 RepID=UPI0030CD2DB2